MLRQIRGKWKPKKTVYGKTSRIFCCNTSRSQYGNYFLAIQLTAYFV